MDAKQFVLQKHPGAQAHYDEDHDSWMIFDDTVESHPGNTKILGWGDTAEEAWANAKSRL